MVYSAKVFRVMIASPSDVKNERMLVRKAISKWNSMHSLKKKIVLQPVGWETDSSPELGDGPQSIINRQILENSDLLVGVFWTRLGTPTDLSPSGTAEEIERHVSSGKPAMIYFSSEKIDPDKIDNQQYKNLKEFKNELKTKGLIDDYKNQSEFFNKFLHQLTLKINENEYFRTEISQEDNSETYTGFVPPGPNFDELSNDAKILLVHLSKDPQGYLLKTLTNKGLVVKTNGINFVEENNPRSEAIYDEAVTILEENDLIKDNSGKGKVFKITNKGFKLADKLDSL